MDQAIDPAVDQARTTVELLRRTAQAHGDREAFVDPDCRLTFGAWDRAADGLAAGFARLGVRAGDVVCLLLPSSADYAVCYQAAMRLGAVTSGINPRLGPAEVADIVARTRPTVTVLEETRTPPPGAGAVLRRGELAQACQLAPPRRLPALSAADPVAIVWTSGTTGRPKGALFDHANLAAVSAGAGALSRRGDRRLSPVPFAHVGYMTRMWDEIAHLITVVVTPTPWSASSALHAIEAERVTVAQGVPAQWSLILRHPALDRTELSSLRLAATGASRVPAELVREMKARLGCPVIVRYASTEASLISGSLPDDGDEVVADTVGRASGGVELRIVDDEDRPVSTGETGVVSVRSGAVMRGYWGDEEATAAVLGADGWLRTGDAARLDEAGNLHLVGRRSEMYIRGGYNVYPAEVENALCADPAIEAAAVVGAPDPVLGEIGVAFLVTHRDVSLTEARAIVTRRLADYKAPDRVVRCEALPLTPMHKVDKRDLARRAAAVS